MTKEKLQDKHYDVYLGYVDLSDKRHIVHTKVSIEYTISVLEEINAKKTAAETLSALYDKITELRNLLK